MNRTPGNIATQVSAALESVKHDNELGAALPVPVPRQALKRRLIEQFSQVQQLDTIAVLDERARLKFIVGSESPLQNAVAVEQLLAQIRRSKRPGLVIGQPLRRQRGDEWQLLLAQAIHKPDGRFAGAVVAVVNTKFFKKHEAEIGLGEVPALLFLASQELTVAQVLQQGATDPGLAGSARPFGDWPMTAQHDTFIAPIKPEDESWIVSYRRLPGTVFVVGAAQAYGDILQATLKRRQADITLLAFSVVLLIVVATLADWHKSKRRRAEGKLHETESQLSKAIGSMSDGFSVYDKDDRLVVCNDKYRELYEDAGDLIAPGVSFREVLRAGIRRRLFPDIVPDGAAGDDPTALEQMRRAIWSEGGAVESRHRSGHWFRISKHRSQDGMTVGVYTDITEIKNREHQLLAAKEEAERANRAKTEFFAIMTHELRTPLNAVIGFSEMITGEMLGPLRHEKYMEYIDIIHESGIHLLSVINDILDISRIEARKFELHEEDVDFGAVIGACCRLLKPKAEAAKVRLNSDIPDDLPLLYADARSIKQIVINLLTNAVKFSPQGADAKIEVRYTAAQGFDLVVSDTGIGIAPEYLEKVLLPFSQAEDPMQRTHQGAGLGLPIVKSLVELHGGTLDLRSQVGSGTVVTCRFPAERALAKTLERRQASA